MMLSKKNRIIYSSIWAVAIIYLSCLAFVKISIAADECATLEEDNRGVCIVVGFPDKDGNLVTQIKAEEGEFILMEYFKVIINYLFGILGLIILLFIVYYGILTMFAGVSDQREEGKKGLATSIGGLVLLLSSGLILYTLNPNFYTGYGNNERTTIEETEDEEEEGCTEEIRTECSIDSALKVKAALIKSGNFTISTATDITDSDPTQNIEDLTAGRCPVIQKGADGGKTCYPGSAGTTPAVCETDMTKIMGYQSAMTRTLSALLEVEKGANGTKIGISSLFGDRHQCDAHRTGRGADLNSLGGKRVADMNKDEVCLFAQLVQSRANPSRIIGPLSIDNCGLSGVVGNSGHYNHLHVEF